MQLSRRGDYGVRVILDLAHQPLGASIPAHEIANRQQIPSAFLGKIISQLAIAGLVDTRRGARGGVALARPAERITLLDVVEALEGRIMLNPCLIHAGACPLDETCPVHDTWAQAQSALKAVLAKTTFAELAGRNGRNGHATF
jgi:Rrf2 family protein